MEFYHVLNRGVDKRKIFLNNRDSFRFVHNLYEFNNIHNINPNNTRNFKNAKFPMTGHLPMTGHRMSSHGEDRELLVKIHFFCLMPNHYHLLVSPLVEGGMSLFMKKLNMGYAKYFNEKYNRSGALFQGKYKKVLVESDAHFLWIPYYIHFNPLDLTAPEWREQDRKIKRPKKALDFLASYRWSSHLDYMGQKNFPSVTQRDFFSESLGGERAYAQSIKQFLNEFDVNEMRNITLE